MLAKFPKKKDLASASQKKLWSSTEQPVQTALNYYLDGKGIEYFRIPDELFSFLIFHLNKAKAVHNKSQQIKIKRLLSYLKGWPDNMVHLPLTKKYLISVPIECKSATGSSHGEQKRRGKRLNYQIPRSEDEARKIVNEFIQDYMIIRKELDGNQKE